MVFDAYGETAFGVGRVVGGSCSITLAPAIGSLVAASSTVPVTRSWGIDAADSVNRADIVNCRYTFLRWFSIQVGFYWMVMSWIPMPRAAVSGTAPEMSDTELSHFGGLFVERCMADAPHGVGVGSLVVVQVYAGAVEHDETRRIGEDVACAGDDGHVRPVDAAASRYGSPTTACPAHGILSGLRANTAARSVTL